METLFKVVIKKPFGERPDVSDIIKDYNKAILTDTEDMLKEENIPVRQETNGMVVMCPSKDDAGRLRNIITEFISKTNTVYKKQLQGSHLNNYRWTAYCSNFYEENTFRPSYSSLKCSAGTSSSTKQQKTEDVAPSKKEKTEEKDRGDTKLKITYKKNEAARTFLEAMGKTFLGVQMFTTYDTGEHYKHKAQFYNHQTLLAFRAKLRSLEYEEEKFRYEDFCFTTPSDEKLKIVFKNIKKAATRFEEGDVNKDAN